MRTGSTAFKRGVLALWVLLLTLAAPVPACAADNGVLAEIPRGLSADGALWRECPLGDYVADAARQGTGAQIALIPSGLLKNALTGGDCVTEAGVAELLWADDPVYLYTLTAPQLKALLEDSVSRWQLSEKETIDAERSAYGGFLQISGFTMTADATAAVGERVISITVDGEPLDLTASGQTITAAIPAALKTQSGGVPSGKTLLTLIRGHIVEQGTVEPPEEGRIRVIGAHAQDIISVVSPWFPGLLLVVFLMNAALSKSRSVQTGRGRSYNTFPQRDTNSRRFP